ncbi:hypothetical protein EI74_0014 [Mycoplasma testudineum]|uniref:Uncharacterized protein n=1 Tax=Mycoplasma testudineum TaxID=244584 RepID=A0A4R6IJH3_9MOLU|nr:hypothetical protein [Mycoplasma testudineum]OYD26455.1 hypothetical protein CG473_03890 [Mycoplasma testudineum]TDO22157.1 hypothetical protein EI74_0014 [Mycoplasma testudineum]
MFFNRRQIETDPRVTKEPFKNLWSDRKDQNIWIILFIVANIFLTVVLTGMALYGFLAIYVPNTSDSFYGTYITRLISFVQASNPNLTIGSDYTSQVISTLVIAYPVIELIFASLSLYNTIVLILKFKQSLDFNSYHLLRGRAIGSSSLIISIKILIALIIPFQYLRGFSLQGLTNVHAVLELVVPIVLLVIMILSRRMFLKVVNEYSKIYINEIRKLMTQDLSKQMADGNFMAGFMNQFVNAQENANSVEMPNADIENEELQEAEVVEIKTVENPVSDKRAMAIERLNNLDRDRINKIADELEIFGAKYMDQKDLIEKIVDLTETEE